MGAASGRIDAVMFMLGLVGGIWIFAEAYTALVGFVTSGELGGVTLADLLGLPFWLVGVAVGAMAIGMFLLLAKLERRLAEDGR